MSEEWRSVVGFPQYEVSNLGRVRSLDHTVTYQRREQHSGRTITVTKRRKGQMLRPGTMASGHQIVVLGRGNPFCVHKLVLDAFVGPAPAGTECCHHDDNPANNALCNLRWGTRSENMADFRRNYGQPQCFGKPTRPMA